jgi:hypothetical protein
LQNNILDWPLSHSYDDWTSNLKNVPRSFEVNWDAAAAAKFYFFAQVFTVVRAPISSHVCTF